MYWFPDNSLLINFATVGELDLLRSSLHGSGRVVEAVEYEIQPLTQWRPALRGIDCREWFGSAITFEDEADLRAIDIVRRNRFRGDETKPLEHLGESQTLHLLSTDAAYSGSVWMSEDRAAPRVARRLGVITRDTRDVLIELVAHGEIDAQRAFAVAVAMVESGRPVLRMPEQARELC